MRKILTILALCCLTFLVGGYHLLYQIKLTEVKSAMKATLARTQKSGLTQLVLTDDEAATIEWESNDEFRYKGEMFDAVQIENADGKTIYWCLADVDETRLVEQYLKTHDSSSDKDPSSSLFKLLKAPFLPSTVELTKSFSSHNKKSLATYLLRFSSATVDVNSPPPKNC